MSCSNYIYIYIYLSIIGSSRMASLSSSLCWLCLGPSLHARRAAGTTHGTIVFMRSTTICMRSHNSETRVILVSALDHYHQNTSVPASTSPTVIAHILVRTPLLLLLSSRPPSITVMSTSSMDQVTVTAPSPPSSPPPPSS